MQRFAPGDIHRRHSPRTRHRRTGHEGNAQFSSGVVDVSGVLPIVGQVLVYEDRHHPATLPKDRQHFVPESTFGILGVARGRPGIVSVLGDEQNTIHGQRTRSQGERVGDISSDPEPVGGGQEPTDVVGRPLLDIERGQLQRRLFPRAVEHVRQEQSTGDDICMGIVTVHRGENRDPLLRLQRSHRFPCRVEAGHQDSKNRHPPTQKGRLKHQTGKNGKCEGVQVPSG